MQKVSKLSIVWALGASLIALPCLAGSMRSMTKSAAGASYKLTLPKSLMMGKQHLNLKIMKAGQGVAGAKLKAEISMSDGMKETVKITPLKTGEYDLEAHFKMGGDWQLKLQQSAPFKAELAFELKVAGGHSH